MALQTVQTNHVSIAKAANCSINTQIRGTVGRHLCKFACYRRRLSAFVIVFGMKISRTALKFCYWKLEPPSRGVIWYGHCIDRMQRINWNL